MSEDASPLHQLTTDIDEAISSIQVLGERVQTLESKIRTDRVEFLAFRSSVKRTLGREIRIRERRARVSLPNNILSVIKERGVAGGVQNASALVGRAGSREA